MAYLRKETGTLLIELGKDKVRLVFRHPTVDEMLAALATKYQSSEPHEQAENILRANLELGLACLEGIGTGDLAVDRGAGPETLSSEPGREGYTEDWKDTVRAFFPTLLVALGQYLSDFPTRMEELEKK